MSRRDPRSALAMCFTVSDRDPRITLPAAALEQPRRFLGLVSQDDPGIKRLGHAVLQRLLIESAATVPWAPGCCRVVQSAWPLSGRATGGMTCGYPNAVMAT